MISYLKLIRLPNLFIIALSMFLVRQCLILPVFLTMSHATGTFPPHLSYFQFIFLTVSTLLIAAGGYIINDYFDIHIDAINKPEKNIVGKKISAQTARRLFFILSGIGIIIGFVIAKQIDRPVMGTLHLFTVASLWMYSSHFKRRFLSGNFIISLLCALSILITGFFEPEFYGNFNLLLWFAIPAFLLTFVRELIKDIEDVDGDELSQCKTAPIVIGITKTKILIVLLLLGTLGYVSYVLYKNFYINTVVSFWYLLLSFAIPFAALLYLVTTAEAKRDYHYASLFSKVLMFAGILCLVPLWYFFIK